MAGISVDQYRRAQKRNRVIEANEFFASTSAVGNNITNITNGGEGNLAKNRIQSQNLLKQAEKMRKQYEAEGNTKMVKSIDTATQYLHNVNGLVDNVIKNNDITSPLTDTTPVSPTSNKLATSYGKALNKFAGINYQIFNQNKDLSFSELTNKQVENAKAGKPSAYNQILENMKMAKGTDDDYVKAVADAKSKLKNIDEDKDTAVANVYNNIISNYSDYAKYGKSNMEKWTKQLDGMDYKQKHDYITDLTKKYNTNQYQQQLNDTIKNYPSGNDYINSLPENEKPTVQGFLDYMDNNNKGFYHEQREYEKNTNSKHTDIATAKNNLLTLEKKANDWENDEAGKTSRNNELEYLNKYAKSTAEDNYDDQKALYDEYTNKIQNAKTWRESQDIQNEYMDNYGTKYLTLKQEHNYDLLSDEDKQALKNRYILESKKANADAYNNATDEERKEINKMLGTNLKGGVTDTETIKKKYNLSDREADAVTSYAKSLVNADLAQQEEKEYTELGKEHPVLGSLLSVPMSLKGINAEASNIGSMLGVMSGSETPIDWNSEQNREAMRAQNTRQGVKDKFGNNAVFNLVYDSLMSTADSAATIPLNAVVPGATGLILNSSAAGSSMLDAHNKGVSDTNAVATGIGAGIFEGLFEQLSLDKLVDVSGNMTKQGIKGILKGVAKSSAIEGSEEGFTEIANILWDSAINGDLSDYKLAYNSYLQQGLSKSEAKKQTDIDMAKRIALNVGGGMLGGLFFSAPSAAMNIKSNKVRTQVSEKGQKIIDNNTNVELEDYIKDNYEKDSKVYKLMKNSDMQDPMDVGYLSNVVELEEYNKATKSYDETMVPAIASRLEELNVPTNEATKIAQETVENFGKNKNVDYGQYTDAYQQVKQDITDKSKGKAVEWIDKLDMSQQAEHIERMKRISKLGEGQSLKTEKQQSIERNQQEVEAKVNDTVESKIDEGKVVNNGRARLVEDEDTRFNVLSLAVGTDGRTKVNTDTRKTYDIDDVIVDRKTAELSEFANQYEGKDRQKFFRSYDENNHLSPTQFAMYYNEAYRYGSENLGIESALKNRRLTNVLNTDAIARAFDSGKAEYRQKIKQNRVVTNNNNKGKVVFDNVATEMLNDTQRAAVDVARTLSDVTGVTYEFFDSKKDDKGNYVGENGSYNRKENKIRVDINAGMINSTEGSNVMVVTLAHELTHYAENLAPTEYANLQEFVFNKLSNESGKNIEQLIAEEIEKNGGKISEDVAKSELVARGCEAMLTDGESIKALAKQDAGLFAKIKTKIDQFCNKIIKACKEILNPDGSIKDSAISKEAQMLQNYAEELRGLWSEAVKSAGESNASISENMEYNTVFANNQIYRFSRRESFSEQVDRAIKNKWKEINALYVSETPEILQQIGLKQLPMLYTKKHLMDALKPKDSKKHQHGLRVEQVKMMPEIIEHPAMVIDSLSRDDSIVVISDKCDDDNLPIIVSIRIDGSGVYELKQVPSNFITAMYGREGTVEMIGRAAKEDKILYINRKKAMTLFSLARIQFPYSLNKYDFDGIIHKSNYVVNDRTTNNEKRNDNEILKQNRTDSEGNKLTKEQQEYFKDSKVRDEEGNLRVVYHGTDADFTVFDRTKTRSKMDIQGSFFSPWEIDADGYGGRTKSYYLNIKNPASEAIGYEALNKFAGRNDAGIKAREYLESLGYDGVNNGNEEYIIFDSNQAKLLENKNPTNNEDIRYQDRNTDVIKKTAGKLGVSERFLESNLEGRSRGSAVQYLKNNSQVRNSFISEKGLEVTPVLKEPTSSYVMNDSIKEFVQENNVSYKKLSENSQLREQYAELIEHSKDGSGKKFLIRRAQNNAQNFIQDMNEALDGNKKSKEKIVREIELAKGEASAYDDGMSMERGQDKLIKEHSKDFEEFISSNITPMYDNAERNKNEFAQNVKDNVEHYVKKAEKHFGTTNDYSLAAYIDINGKMLDFSDGGNIRGTDHRGIAEILDTPSGVSGTEALTAFMNAGNIRIMDTGIDISVEPNAKQISVLRDYIASRNGEIYVDFSKEDGTPAGSARYSKGTSGSRILADINNYFKDGTIPENTYNSMSDFLYQDRNSNNQKLTAQQEEYFKDSKVRDDEGRLMVMYHGTPTGGFTVFKNDLQFFTSNKEYASFYEDPSASSRKSGKEKANPQTYEVYLNMEHPFDIRDEETRELFINDYVKGGWALGINPYEEYKDTTKTGLPSWEEADNIYEWLEENEMLDDYDGIVVDEGGFLGEDNKVVDRGISYVTFNSNQIKNITNENPTNNEDIRYQDRNTDSSREILATALESTVKNDTERQLIKNYRDNIDKLYDLDKKLDIVNGALKEMYFAPGNKPISTIKDLQQQANGIRKQMKRYENNLLRLESTKTLKNFVERENKAAVTKQRQIDAERLKEYRTRQNERFDRMQKRYQESAKQKVENRKRIEARNKVIKRVDKLNNWLEKPNNKKHIPAKFMHSTVSLLEGLNQDGMNVAQRLDEVRQQMAGYTEVPQNLVNRYNDLLERKNRMEERAENLAKFYKQIESDPDYAGNYSQTVMDQIEKMKETVKDKPIGAMNVQELNTVKDTIDLLTNEIQKWNETLDTKFIDGEGNKMDVKEISDKAYKEVMHRGTLKDTVVQTYFNSQLSPTRFFKKIGGYAKNSVWNQLGEMLNEGQRDKLRYEQGAAAIFSKVTSNKKGKTNWKNLSRLSKETVEVGLVDEDGNPVKITKGMMLSVYMHLQNEENLRHSMYGGFSVPEIKNYYKGKRTESFSQVKKRVLGVSTELAQLGKDIQKAIDRGATDSEIAEIEKGHEEIIERGKMQMAEIKNNIESIISKDQYLQDWVDCSKEYFDVYSKNAINDVTMKRYSMKKAGVENYFPIHTDSNYLAKGKEGKGSRAVNLENSGFMQDRVKSTKPIYLEDITNVVNDAISGTGTYVGYLIPQYNYNRILGYTANGYKENIKTALDKKMGTQAVDYLSRLEKDLFGGRNGEGTSKFMSKMRGRVAQGALTLNVPVSMGQAASYFTAAPVVGWKNLSKALARGGKNGLPISSADRELINKYSPLLWYRNLGNVSQDIHDASNTDGLYNKINDKTNGYLFGWIQKADVATVGRLWYASQYYVDDHFENLQKGTDEYYKQVAKVFNKVVEETQPNYTVMQRPGVLRSQNEIVKSITMFSTQRMQNYNILYDSIATARKYRQDYKKGINGVTREDVKEANRTARRAITSQIVSAAVLSVMKTSAALLLLQWKNFGDDEDEFKKENVYKYGVDQFFSNVAGTVVGGTDLYSFVSALVKDDTYYGVSLTGFDAVTDFVEEIEDFASKTKNGKASAKDTTKLIKNFSTFMGIPYAQAKKIYEGVTGWTSYTVAKMQGNNPDLKDYAQTNEVTTTNKVKKIINQDKFDKETFGAVMQEVEAGIKEDHPEYSPKELKKKTQSSVRSRFSKILKEKYKNKELTKNEVAKQMLRTGLYTGKSTPYKTINNWNKE